MIESAAPQSPGRNVQLGVWLVQAAAIVVVVAVATWKQFELDRFFVPKELTLHLGALLAAVLLFNALRRLALSRIDALLAAFLLLSVISVIFAQNPWLGARAATLSISSITLYWCSRCIGERGHGNAIVIAVATGTVVACITSLLQTYGVRTELFSLNRAPGGTLGNRNFVAHIAAIGSPILVLTALQARFTRGFILAAVCTATCTAALVLTRSRAGWLAFAASTLLLLACLVLSPALRRSGRVWLRLLVVVLLAAAGVAAAVTVPNTLRWRSENPYLESMRDVANYQEGSGRGRLVQYRRSLEMALHNPLLGAGPGNWAVEYPRFADDNDPSLDRNEPGTTSNPWPSSDWIAFVAERGVLAAAALAGAIALIALTALRRVRRAADDTAALHAAALIAMLAATVVAGLFDAVLLLALPATLVWSAAGALHVEEPQRVYDLTPARRSFAVALLVLFTLVGALRSGAQLAGMGLYATREGVNDLLLAARVDPGNYRVRMALAQSGLRRARRCEHALAARELMPRAAAARAAARGCK